MNRGSNQESARIYQFPAAGRRAALGQRHHDEGKASIDRNAPRVNETICSDSWYHEAAIEDERRKWDR